MYIHYTHICPLGAAEQLGVEGAALAKRRRRLTFAYTILYDTILYYTILYNTILYNTILVYTIPYHTIPYYTILYYTIPYYTIPYHNIYAYYTML